MEDLLDRALRASRERQEKNAKSEREADERRERERIDGTVQLLQKIGVQADEITVRVGRVIATGLEFSSYNDPYNYRRQLVMVGSCPNCGQPTSSRDIDSIADLGDELQHFEPTHVHRCEFPAREEETAQPDGETLRNRVARLIRLLDEIKQEVEA